MPALILVTPDGWQMSWSIWVRQNDRLRYPMLSTLGRSVQEDPGEDLGLRGTQCGPNIC